MPLLPLVFRFVLAASALHTATAVVAPSLPDYNAIWTSDFNGTQGAQLNQSQWQQYIGPVPDSELQSYTNSTDNVMLSGGGSLMIMPTHTGSDPHTGWMSGRIETREGFACESGKMMVLQAEIKLGDNVITYQKGVWPSFYALGTSKRSGTPWPQCGEWGIMQTNNGGGTMWQSSHVGLGDGINSTQSHSNTSFPFVYEDWHTWAIKIDRTAETWQNETIQWLMDGQETFRRSGADVGNFEEWDALARKSYYLVLNVAIGGACPSGLGNCQPNNQTRDGEGNGMEVKYVAVYASI